MSYVISSFFLAYARGGEQARGKNAKRSEQFHGQLLGKRKVETATFTQNAEAEPVSTMPLFWLLLIFEHHFVPEEFPFGVEFQLDRLLAFNDPNSEGNLSSRIGFVDDLDHLHFLECFELCKE